MKLQVYFRKSLIGQIDPSWDFRYAEAWLEQASAFGISLSLPLQRDLLPRKESRNFFANLLPEATLRENICKSNQIDYDDDFSLLGLVGGECAGALQIISEKSQPFVGRGSYEEVSIEALCARLNARPSMPLVEVAAELRMSLAGAQDKLPVLYRDGRFHLPQDGAASSHILRGCLKSRYRHAAEGSGGASRSRSAREREPPGEPGGRPSLLFRHPLKPASARFPDSVANEAFSMELAKRLGFIVPDVRIIPSDPPFVLIERYDRKLLPDGTVERLHQEDFCQALGIAHQKKYESDGGPGFAKCAEVLEKTSSPGLNRLRLAQWGILNALIGNADAHGKNLSLLYGESRIPNMAPIYDLLSTTVYPELSPKMAMHIGGERLFDRIYGSQWERFARDVSLSKRRTFSEIETMSDRMVEQAERLAGEMEREHGASEFYSKALSIISKNCAIAKKR